MSKIVLVSLPKDNKDSKITLSKRKRAAILTALLIIAFVMLGMVSQTGYAVSIDGEVVGTVKNGAEMEKIIEEVEADVSDVLGYDYEINADVELTGTFGGSDENIAAAFMRSVEEIAVMPILEIDGEYVLCAKSEEEIRKAVDMVKSVYEIGEGSTVSFDNVITVRFDYAPVADTKNAFEIAEILDPANGGEFALKVRTVTHETGTEAVAFSTEYVDDPEIYEGTRVVVAEGADGTADVTEKVEYVNGVVVSRVEISRIVTLEPEAKVIAVGTKFRPAWVSYGEYIRPCEGVVTSYFGPRTVFYGYSYHEGVDIASNLNTPIVASDGGEVIYAGTYYGYGLMVDIKHDNGDVTRYAHLNEINVEEGQKVARGELIAFMGTTGVSSGVHLHFEIQKDGEPVDPFLYIPE